MTYQFGGPRRVWWLLATMVFVGAAAISVPSGAVAAVPRQNSAAERITRSVLMSAHPHAVFAKLSRAQKSVFLSAFGAQTAETVVDVGGRYTPTATELAAMSTSAAPQTVTVRSSSSGCWYRYWYKSWSDFGIHDGDSWLQLNWCGSKGKITSWSQSNYGCAGHHGASCSVAGRADSNVGWEVRSTRYYKADFFGYSNTFCMQIRGGATGLYSENSSSTGGCPSS